MTWTNEQRRELSRKVAEKFGVIEIFEGSQIEDTGIVYESQKWLHDDWHTIMELCVKHGVDCWHNERMRFCISGKNACGLASMNYYDHNNEPSLAERIARLLALLEVEL